MEPTSNPQKTISEFLLDNIEHDIAWAVYKENSEHETSLRSLIKVVEEHKKWPVLIQGTPEIQPIGDDGGLGDLNTFRMRWVQHFNFVTSEEYVKKFGSEPPTAPILRILVQKYKNRPGFNPEWEIK